MTFLHFPAVVAVEAAAAAGAVEVVEAAGVETLTMREGMSVVTTDTKTMITGTGNVLTWDFCSELGDSSIWHF